MFKGGDDFEGSIDIHGILNDASLHDELRSLGWVESGAPPPARPAQPKQVNAKAAAGPTLLAVEHDDIEPLDIGSIGILDEANLTLDENDLQDKSLLAEFNIINGEWGNDADTEQEEQSNKTMEIGNALSADAHKSITSPVVAVQPTSQNSGIPSVEEAKKNAVKYKREGNTTEALKWLRYAKQLESGTFNAPELLQSNAPQQAMPTTGAAGPSKATTNPSATSRSPPNPVTLAHSTPLASDSEPKSSGKTYSTAGGDLFAPLESAIVEASEAALKEAKAVRDTDKVLAVTRMREYKALQQELAVLQSRRNTPGAAPALFHWQTLRKETVVENMEIAEDEVKVTIEGAFNIAGVVEAHSSRSISVSYMLGIAKDETAPTVVPAATYQDGNVVFNYEAVSPVLKRGRHVQQLYQRKKAVFDLVLHRGFWKGTAVLCQAVLPLSDLLTKSKIGGPLELKTVSESGTSKRGKTVGGQLTVYVSIRSPLSGPEVKVLEERKLVIEAWPVVVAPSPVQSSSPSTPLGVTVAESGTTAPSSISPTPPAMSGVLATLTEQEKSDPHSVDFLESNDVLEAEIRAAEALAHSSQDDDERFNAGLRQQLLQGKLQLLVYQVQNDQLSFDDYLAKIRVRLQRDQLIALYFKTLGDKDSTAAALSVMKRVLIMKKELQSAEQGGGGEEDEG